MIDFKGFALNMLKNTPIAANNPMSQQIISAIQNQDYNAAQEIANRICQERGMSIDEAQKMTEQGMQQFPNFR